MWYMEDDSIEVTCERCGYTWEYSGITPYAQCGACGKSNNLNA